jgi:hypothetical protein
MSEVKLLLITSKKEIEKDALQQWTLKESCRYAIGRGSSNVDIDLSFDPSVSRQHAEIWFEEGTWWIKDNSAYGTKINGEKIPKAERIRLKFDDEISMGNKTTLKFIPAWRECYYLKDLWIEMEVADSLNYALLHNNLPFLEKIILHNRGKTTSDSLKLRLSLGDYFDKIYEIPHFSIGKSFIIKPDLKIDPEILENQTEISLSLLKVFINDSLLIEKRIKILAYNEWSKEEISYHRTSLASFVLPNHPYIEQITAEIRELLKINKDDQNKTFSSEFLNTLYNYFRTQWKIDYIDELPSFESNSQRIRLPHQILLDWHARKGAGTCIDLSLLFASCLENMGFQPLLLIFEIKPGLCHAIGGCWKEKQMIMQALFNERTQIKKEILIIDPTGFARGFEFEKALTQALEITKKKKFLYALDITAARRCKILPLPFSGRPKESTIVIRVDRKARELAEEIGQDTGYKVYSSVHILLSLLLVGDRFTKEVFKRAGLNIKKAKELFEKGLKSIKPHRKIEKLKPSEHYKLVWVLALNLAKEEGSPFVLEKHLFFALLETESQALDKAINSLGTNREILKEAAYSLLKTRPFSETEKSFFGSTCSPDLKMRKEI